VARVEKRRRCPAERCREGKWIASRHSAASGNGIRDNRGFPVDGLRKRKPHTRTHVDSISAALRKKSLEIPKLHVAGFILLGNTDRRSARELSRMFPVTGSADHRESRIVELRAAWMKRSASARVLFSKIVVLQADESCKNDD